MKGKKWLVILLTVLVFLSSTVLGVSSVYRIDAVLVDAKTISSFAEGEAVALQKRLVEVYDKQSTLFAKTDEAYAVVEDFPYFRITKVEKSYPNRLIVHVTEDDEVYAVADTVNEGTYYILNKEGTILGVRDNYNNRSDTTGQSRNVLIKGITPSGKKGETLSGDDTLTDLFAVCKKVDELLQGIRRNILSVEKMQASGSGSTVTLKFTTYEGVIIYIRSPKEQGVEKASVAIRAYLALDDAERTRGMLAVTNVQGEAKAVYSDKDVFDEME